MAHLVLAVIKAQPRIIKISNYHILDESDMSLKSSENIDVYSGVF